MILLLNKAKTPIFSAWGLFEVNRDYYCMVKINTIIEYSHFIFILSTIRAGDLGQTSSAVCGILLILI
jgi:hypothetical protein